MTPKLFYIDVIILYIIEYIKYDNNLLNCNKYLSKLKKFILNREYSLKYIHDSDFKNLINSKIKCSKSGLSLNLSFSSITDKDLKDLDNLYKLDLTSCNNITDEGIKYLGDRNINWLILGCSIKITDKGIKLLVNLHTLQICGCDNITDEGIQCLVNLHTLQLVYCDTITDKGIKCLYKLDTLRLNSCNKITDKGIKFLVNLHSLYLASCVKITDQGIKCLVNLHELFLNCFYSKNTLCICAQ